MVIKYHDFEATRVNISLFKCSFMVFIGRDPKPDKEKHDFMFSINMFMIDYKHQTTPIKEVFLNAFALTDLKAMIQIEFLAMERDESRKNSVELKRVRNSSLPAILSPDSFENWNKNDKSNSKIQLKSSRNNKRGIKNDEEYCLKVIFYY